MAAVHRAKFAWEAREMIGKSARNQRMIGKTGDFVRSLVLTLAKKLL